MLKQSLAQAGVNNASLSFGLAPNQYAAHLPEEKVHQFVEAFKNAIPDRTGIEVEDTYLGEHLSTGAQEHTLVVAASHTVPLELEHVVEKH